MRIPHRPKLHDTHNEVIIIIITNEKIKVMLSRKRPGALYKIITREKLVNVNQNCGRIEMSSAGV